MTTTVDAGRLRRASLRTVERIAPDRYFVEGRSQERYLVDLSDATPCNCIDAQRRNGGCLHELAARLAAGDPALVHQLGELLANAERELRTLQQRTRKQRVA